MSAHHQIYLQQNETVVLCRKEADGTNDIIKIIIFDIVVLHAKNECMNNDRCRLPAPPHPLRWETMNLVGVV